MELNLDSTWQREWVGKRILALHWPSGRYEKVGEAMCKEIVAYSEPSDNAYVLWFEVRYGNGLLKRYNSRMIEGVSLGDPDYDALKEGEC